MPRLKFPTSSPFHVVRFISMFVAAMMFIASPLAFAQTESILHDFIALPHGSIPQAPLVSDAFGNLYGTTVWGGTYGWGTVFELSPTKSGKWTQTVLYSFQGGIDGSAPVAGLVFDSAGNLYGTTSGDTQIYEFGSGCALADSCGTVFKLSPNSNGTWTETVLHDFGAMGDGGFPLGRVVFDKSGNLYGTTEYGGTGQYGIVFELSPAEGGAWTENILYNFTDETDGGLPVAGVALDAAGNVYGTTSAGGDINCDNDQGYQPYGCGTVFELTPNSNGSWTESVLQSFNWDNGALPLGNIILDAQGNIYGTTQFGPGLNCSAGCGTVFKLAASNGSWTYSIVYTFAGGSDGQDPASGLVEDSNGNFYGTTAAGGSTSGCSYGCGTVFELTPTRGLAWTEKVLHSFGGSASFPNGSDGNNPLAGVILDSAGNLYGTASLGGSPAAVTECIGVDRCAGTVFKLTRSSSGKFTTSLLYSFTASGDGLNPNGGLVADSAGNLYGAAQYGGGYGYGSLYKLTPQSGGGYSESVLYSFTGGSDGGNPSGKLVFDSAGNLYGGTYNGGTPDCAYNSGCGVVYELSPASGAKWTEQVIHSFVNTDGAQSNSSLVFDSHGNLYGTTTGGGTLGQGTAFELSPSGGSWTFASLFSFSGTNGYDPGPVVLDTADNLYGTAQGGTTGSGLAFELSSGSSGWTQTILHAFTTKTDGISPFGLVFLKPGTLVGVTYEGGNYTNCYYGCGAVFEVTQVGGTWQKRNLYTFQGGTDGSNPLTVPIVDAEGNIYGTTVAGGSGPCLSNNSSGCGTIYKLSPSSGTSTDTILYSFGTNPHDVYDASQLLLSSSNILYGAGAGGDDGNGAVFQLDLTQPSIPNAEAPQRCESFTRLARQAEAFDCLTFIRQPSRSLPPLEREVTNHAKHFFIENFCGLRSRIRAGMLYGCFGCDRDDRPYLQPDSERRESAGRANSRFCRQFLRHHREGTVLWSRLQALAQPARAMGRDRAA